VKVSGDSDFGHLFRSALTTLSRLDRFHHCAIKNCAIKKGDAMARTTLIVLPVVCLKSLYIRAPIGDWFRPEECTLQMWGDNVNDISH
jgi:hypothetical protein